MRNILAIVLIFGIIMFGCIGNQKQTEQINCLDYCQNQPHAQCIGGWQINGQYPNCRCNYVCQNSNQNQSHVEPQNNTITPPIVQTNNTVSTPIQNVTPPTPSRPLQTRELNDTIESHLQKIRNDFYASGFSGRFQEQKNIVYYTQENTSGNEIPIGELNAISLKISSRAVNNVKAVSSIEYTDLDSGSTYEYALLIVQTNMVSFGSGFTMEFNGNRLTGCDEYFAEDYQDAQGVKYTAYDITCDRLRRS